MAKIARVARHADVYGQSGRRIGESRPKNITLCEEIKLSGDRFVVNDSELNAPAAASCEERV